MDNHQNAITPRIVFQMFINAVIIPFLPLLISMRWDWWEAWVYGLIFVLSFALSRLLIERRYPDLLDERARLYQHANAKSWDKPLVLLITALNALIPLSAGLEASSGGTVRFSLPLKIVALAAILAGHLLCDLAMLANRFFSGIVRIQTERGHQVVSSGPYRWLRHPGYAGALIIFLATPFFLDSPWTFLPVGIVTIVLFVRTYLEDRTLQQELPGYREYAQRVRSRLIPGVW